MSADEFDPFVERLFARAPHMPDAALFAADVQTKLAKSSRVRTLALTAAGLFGGVIAVRQTVNVDLNLADSPAPAVGRGIEAAGVTAGGDVMSAVQSALTGSGLDQLSLGSMGAMQLFWVTAGLIVALAAAGAVKLSQEI